MRASFLNQAMEFVGREMVAGFQKRAQDGVALSRLLQADSFQMAVEDVLRLADHLGRDCRLVIDAFLQHSEGNRRSGYHPVSRNEIQLPRT